MEFILWSLVPVTFFLVYYVVSFESRDSAQLKRATLKSVLLKYFDVMDEDADIRVKRLRDWEDVARDLLHNKPEPAFTKPQIKANVLDIEAFRVVK